MIDVIDRPSRFAVPTHSGIHPDIEEATGLLDAARRSLPQGELTDRRPTRMRQAETPARSRRPVQLRFPDPHHGCGRRTRSVEASGTDAVVHNTFMLECAREVVFGAPIMM